MKRIIKIFLAAIVAIPCGVAVMFMWLYFSADMMIPLLDIEKSEYNITQHADTLYCQDSYLYRSESGLWEMKLTGSRAQRGAKQGALTQELMKYQEDVFIDQIRRIIPSDSYLGFLRKFLIIFNRNIAKHIDLEYREEIAAMSLFCTDEYNAIGTPYERQLNYHAAHDIGHTMQQYMLVGCSSFALWGDKSCDSELLIGRNFDFFMGEDFANNKIITFASPQKGYKYASIGWAGMVGVLSGINEQGLTVTINAAQGTIPISAKTPISILTREIVQYASTIEEAFAIASSRETFVNESILIGSAKDGKAAIIEKTPHQTALYESCGEQIICTNHYQSEELYNTDYNQENILMSDSKYRFDRLSELLLQRESLTYSDAITTLRDRFGLEGQDIGIGNEMTLNQSIAHHSVVFSPSSNLMWVSTAPWQSGDMICYDLTSFFKLGDNPTIDKSKSVSADAHFIENDLHRLLEYREGLNKIKEAQNKHSELSDEYIDNFLLINPNHYYTYRAVGDYYAYHGDKARAKRMYEEALQRAIPYLSEREEIEEIIIKKL